MTPHFRRNLLAYGVGSLAALTALGGGITILFSGHIDNSPTADYPRQVCGCAARLPPGFVGGDQDRNSEERDRQAAKEQYQDRLRTYCMAADGLVIAEQTLWVTRLAAIVALVSMALAIVGLLITVGMNRDSIDRWGRGEGEGPGAAVGPEEAG